MGCWVCECLWACVCLCRGLFLCGFVRVWLFLCVGNCVFGCVLVCMCGGVCLGSVNCVFIYRAKTGKWLFVLVRKFVQIC